MIEAPARDALSLRLVLREPEADERAAAFVNGLGWPTGTSVRVIDRQAGGRRRAPSSDGMVRSRLRLAGVRVIDETRAFPADAITRPRHEDLVMTGASRTGGGLRRFIAESLAELDAPVLLAGRPCLDRGLVVVDDDLHPSLVDLLRRDPFRRAHLRVLGVVDVSVPWYAGLAFSADELLESVTVATDEGRAHLEAATRQTALALSWAGVAASAHVEDGNAERTIIRVARDMAADWIVFARAVDSDDGVLRVIDKLVAEASILIAPRAEAGG
jgi:hypothetical protein